MSVSYKSLPGPFGVEILDIDLASKRSEETIREIVSIFYRQQFVVIRNQSIDLGTFDAFTRKFGVQRPHVLDHLRMADHPSILMLSNIHENGRQLGVFEGASFWHTDVAYQDPPNSATVVYAIQVPRDGAPTHIADMFGAYDALPERTKREIDDLVVVHHYGNREDMREGSPTAAERLMPQQRDRVKSVHQPLVMRHPATGRRSLYGLTGSSFGIVGMPDDEALGLLRELTRHATRPEFTIIYDYAKGDVAAWDAYSTLHKASLQQKAVADDPHARLLWRVSVSGISPLISPHIDMAARPTRTIAGMGKHQ